MTIDTNFSKFMQRTQTQARRLLCLPDTTPYNDFVDATLKSQAFKDSATDEAKTLAKMLSGFELKMPGPSQRTQLYQTCLQSAIDGSISAIGGPGGVLAKAVMDLLPTIPAHARGELATDALCRIAVNCDKGSEARQHAYLALDAVVKADSQYSKDAIALNGLGLIAGETNLTSGWAGLLPNPAESTATPGPSRERWGLNRIREIKAEWNSSPTASQDLKS